MFCEALWQKQVTCLCRYDAVRVAQTICQVRRFAHDYNMKLKYCAIAPRQPLPPGTFTVRVSPLPTQLHRLQHNCLFYYLPPLILFLTSAVPQILASTQSTTTSFVESASPSGERSMWRSHFDVTCRTRVQILHDVPDIPECPRYLLLEVHLECDKAFIRGSTLIIFEFIATDFAWMRGRTGRAHVVTEKLWEGCLWYSQYAATETC